MLALAHATPIASSQPASRTGDIPNGPRDARHSDPAG
jgi:hypothetical protein